MHASTLGYYKPLNFTEQTEFFCSKDQKQISSLDKDELSRWGKGAKLEPWLNVVAENIEIEFCSRTAQSSYEATGLYCSLICSLILPETLLPVCQQWYNKPWEQLLSVFAIALFLHCCCFG